MLRVVVNLLKSLLKKLPSQFQFRYGYVPDFYYFLDTQPVALEQKKKKVMLLLFYLSSSVSCGFMLLAQFKISYFSFYSVSCEIYRAAKEKTHIVCPYQIKDVEYGGRLQRKFMGVMKEDIQRPGDTRGCLLLRRCCLYQFYLAFQRVKATVQTAVSVLLSIESLEDTSYPSAMVTGCRQNTVITDDVNVWCNVKDYTETE